MSEHKEPIPSMIYNAAVGGHVTNSQQIIDENLNREQQDINEEVAAIPYNATTPNGMGKIVLKKNDNFKQVVEAQTNGNTIFVIKYDFTLTGNVTVPVNCILEFEGGSISGAYTLTGNNTGIKAGLVKIFNTNITLDGSWNIVEAYPEWFGAKGDGTTNDTLALQKTMTLGAGIEIQFKKEAVYAISDTIVANPYSTLNGNNATLKAIDDYDIILQANNVDGLIIDGNGYQNQYGILVSNTLKDSYIRNCNIKNIKNDDKNVSGIIINNHEENNHHVTIENNLIENLWSKDNGVVADFPGDAVGISTYTENSLSILNNVIHNIKVADDGYGIYVGKRNNVYSVIVAGNYIYDVYNTGIKWHMTGAVVTNNKIDMDPVDANSQKMGYGIRMYGSDSKITQNHITYSGNAAMYGIFVDGANNVKIDHNIINCPHGSLAINLGGNYNIVSNHYINTDYTGDASVIGIGYSNTFINNVIKSAGISLSVGANSSVIGNVIEGTVSLSYAHNSIIKNNSIKDTIQENYISNNVIIEGNDIGAIYFAKSQSGVIIKGNNFHEVSFTGSIVLTGSNAVIADNVVKHASLGIAINGNGNNVIGNIADAPEPIQAGGRNHIITLNQIPNGTSINAPYVSDCLTEKNLVRAV